MVTSRKSMRWILLGAATVIVLAGAGITAWIWQANYRAWHNPRATPLFGQIEPADGATVYESDLWISWSSPEANRARVLWRKRGDLRVRDADAGSGQELLAHLAPVTAGAKYEYIVEETRGDQTLRSSVRTLNVKSGLAFEPVVEQTIERDYDETVKLTLRNRSSQPIVVSAKALKRFADLPADITGYGSVEVPAQLAPNSTLDLRLAVTADDATRGSYEIPVEAAGAYVTARFNVHIPKLSLSFSIAEEDPKTLTKTIYIHNKGDTLSDFTVRVVPANQQDLELQPAVNHALLHADSGVYLRVAPILYLEFQSLKAKIEASAAGQTAHFPLEFQAPPGVRLIAFRSASTWFSFGFGRHCTNHPNSCSIVPGHGNGPAPRPQPKPEGSPVGRSPLLSSRQGSVSVADQFQTLPGFGEVPFHSASSKDSAGVGGVTPGEEQSKQPLDCYNLRDLYEAAENQAQHCRDLFMIYMERERKMDVDKAITDVALLREIRAARNCESEQRNQADKYLAEFCAGVCYNFPNFDTPQWLPKCRPPSPKPGECSNNCEDCYKKAKHLVDIYWGLYWALKAVQQGGGPTIQPRVQRNYAISLEKELETNIDQLRSHWWDLQEQCGAKHCYVGGWSLVFALGAKGNEVPGTGQSPTPFPQSAKDFFRKMQEYWNRAAEDTRDKGHIWDDIVHHGRILVHSIIRARAEQDLADEYGALADDPVLASYKVVESPAVKPLAVNGKNDLERADLAATDAIRWERAYIHAWLLSFERYRGAKDAHDTEWTNLLSDAMGKFSESAVAAAWKYAARKYEFDNLAHEVLGTIKARISTGERLKDILKSRAESTVRQPLEPEARETLLASGISDDDITKYLRLAVAKTPDQVEEMIQNDELKVATTQKTRDELARSAPGVQWPQPPDIVALESLQLISWETSLKADSREGLDGWISHDPDEKSPGAIASTYALQRQARFNRAHRGPLAAPQDGNSDDSSSMAAALYAGERTYFAWHQMNDQIVFALFDPAGRLVLEPQVIGRGRWPRLAADGNRVAVAWNSSDGSNFIARLNENKQWGAEIPLAGRDAALAFAPSGPLYAATSNGLWKLSGDHFDRVQEANYAQPAIALDKDGKPHVAWRRNGRIVYNGTDVGEGERPSVIIAPDGTVSVAYISTGSVVVRSARAGQWSDPDTIPAKNPSWPTLALDSNGAVRLSHIGAADYGPDALWLVRLPDKQPILVPSLAGNVTDAWLTVNFNLEDTRSNYRPHDVLLTVNDVWVKMFQNTVPDGRYLFRLNPHQIFTSPGQPAPNRVAIKSWHMNPGHYAIGSNYELIVRTAWSEQYAFAANEEEARRGVGTYLVNHDQSDLGIFANATDLPVEMPKPGRMDIPVMVANLGEASSNPVRLVMLGEKNEVLATTQVPALNPGADKTVRMPFDYDGKLAQLTFRLEENRDFNLRLWAWGLRSNDSLTLTLWGPKPTGYVGPEPGLPKAPLELKVGILNGPELAAQYRIVDAFSRRVIAKVVSGDQFGPLRSGTYRVAVQPYPDEGKEILFTDTIEHEAGVPQTVQLNSGISIVLPAAAGSISQWSVVEAGNPGRVVQWQNGRHPLMALPPGDYQLAILPMDQYSQRLVWPDKVRVEPGQHTTVKLDSTVLLDMAKDAPLGRWELVRFGKPDEVVQWQLPSFRTMVIPPGDYQVATLPMDQYSQRLVWPDKVRVEPGQQARARLDGGVRLEMPKDAPLARWQLVRFGKPEEVIQWQLGSFRTMVVPSGEYQLDVKADESGPWKTVADSVSVRQGHVTEVRVPEIPK